MALVLPECKSALLYEEINSLVIEYLELNGLEKTIATFSSECRSRSLPGPFNNTDDTKAAFSYYEGERLMKCFDEGHLDTFVKLWKSFQGHVQVTTDDMKKLEVYLRVHFALYPCAHGEPDAVQTQAMNNLKVFFEEQSCQLSHDATILPLFALPYVADPKNHPIFRDLFQPNWSQRLRAQLEATLLKYFDLLQQNLGVHSKLAAIVINANANEKELNYKEESQDNNNITNSLSTIYHRDRFFQLVSTYRQARKLLKNTRESYGKLLKIANELIIGLEASVDGQSLSLEPIMKRCYEIFPELFTPIDTNGTIGQPDKEYFKRLAQSAQFDNIIDSDVSLFFIGISDMSPDNLDYNKIKFVLRSEETNNGDKLCLLQSMRWLLTKSTPKCRQTALSSFIEADILGLHAQTDAYRIKLFECLLSPNPTYLKECFTRILNTIASMKSGRAYMGKNTCCVDYLVKSLVTFRGLNESYICQMVIATLQKLSLRKQMRLAMIERNVIPWLVMYLKNEFERSEDGSTSGGAEQENTPIVKYYNPYLMEYAWALLMNLCLHEEANEATSSIANDIISCVTQMLLSKPTREVYPYVISTLYSLLRNPDIFAAAQQLGVQNLFANCPHIDDTEMSHHFSHVTAILQTQGFDRVSTTTGEVDYDDDDDIDPSDFEPEIEVAEAWEESLNDGNMTGDDLLMRKYLLINENPNSNSPSSPRIPSPLSQNPAITRERPQSQNPNQNPIHQRHNGVLIRPITPSSAYHKGEYLHHTNKSQRDDIETLAELQQQQYYYQNQNQSQIHQQKQTYKNNYNQSDPMKKRLARLDHHDKKERGERDSDSYQKPKPIPGPGPVQATVSDTETTRQEKPSVRSPSLSPNARDDQYQNQQQHSPPDRDRDRDRDTENAIPAYPKILASTAVLETHSSVGFDHVGDLDDNSNSKQDQNEQLLSNSHGQGQRKSKPAIPTTNNNNINSNESPSSCNTTNAGIGTSGPSTATTNCKSGGIGNANVNTLSGLALSPESLLLNERTTNESASVINSHINNIHKLLTSSPSTATNNNRNGNGNDDGISSVTKPVFSGSLTGGQSPSPTLSPRQNNNMMGTTKRKIPRLLEKKSTSNRAVNSYSNNQNNNHNKEPFSPEKKSPNVGMNGILHRSTNLTTTTTTQPG